jgi:hypothetical protein
MLKGILVAGIALALWSSSAIAKEKSSALACAVDIESKCGEVKPGVILATLVKTPFRTPFPSRGNEELCRSS